MYLTKTLYIVSDSCNVMFQPDFLILSYAASSSHLLFSSHAKARYYIVLLHTSILLYMLFLHSIIPSPSLFLSPLLSILSFICQLFTFLVSPLTNLSLFPHVKMITLSFVLSIYILNF